MVLPGSKDGRQARDKGAGMKLKMTVEGFFIHQPVNRCQKKKNFIFREIEAPSANAYCCLKASFTHNALA